MVTATREFFFLLARRASTMGFALGGGHDAP
jgi:hypothetical protein